MPITKDPISPKHAAIWVKLPYVPLTYVGETYNTKEHVSYCWNLMDYMHKLIKEQQHHTSATYRAATAGPSPMPIPTKNLPISMPVKLLVAALHI